MENNRRGNEIFLGVIGVATLVVAIIGATFAYFSASANSAENAITAGSTTISLEYDDSVAKLIKNNLIPSSEEIATYAGIAQTQTGDGKNKRCTDDNGNEVCSIYQFTVSNPNGVTVQQDISYELFVAVNEFTNLSYKIYDGALADLTMANETSNVKVAKNIFPQADAVSGNPINLGALNVSLSSVNNYTQTYTMIFWLDDTGENQSDSNVTAGTTDQTSGNTNEAGKQFAATMTVVSGNGTGVTGSIRAVTNPS